MEKVITFEQLHFDVAGIDMGSQNFFVSVDGKEVKKFETYTSDYHRCIGYLQERGIKHVAMEATGVYWIALYCLLEQNDIKVCLVNPKETRPRKGHKTDVEDCRWIQRLFSAGLLRESFIPQGLLMELRYLVRERLDTIEMGSVYINKIQRCLELMNIKLTEVISQVHGVSGMKMMKAILQGEREPETLLLLCDERIKTNKASKVLKALEGNYNDTYLFMLAENIRMWEAHQQQIGRIDKKIDQLLKSLTKNKSVDDQKIGKAKLIRHHKPAIKDLHEMMVKLFGINASSISGINDYTLLRLAGETGTDMSRFPTIKHFVSWCGLAPGYHKSGKINKRVKRMSSNKAGQIFKEVAQALGNSKTIAIGIFIRKLKVRRNAAIAYKAGARKLAEAYYNALTRGTEYVEQGTKKYEEQLKKKEIAVLKRLAQKHNVQILEKENAA
ncbi:MAG: IS110 family RNA-guided transposase [Flavitalea sp.]